MGRKVILYVSFLHSHPSFCLTGFCLLFAHLAVHSFTVHSILRSLEIRSGPQQQRPKRTIAVYVYFIFFQFISLPFFTKQHGMSTFCACQRTCDTTTTFKISFSDFDDVLLTLFEISRTLIDKLDKFKLLRNSQVECKVVF